VVQRRPLFFVFSSVLRCCLHLPQLYLYPAVHIIIFFRSLFHILCSNLYGRPLLLQPWWTAGFRPLFSVSSALFCAVASIFLQPSTCVLLPTSPFLGLLVFIACAHPHHTGCRFRHIVRRSFPVAASILWNSLPPDIQSSSSLTDFFHRLKTYLFHQSYPDILLKLSTYWLHFRALSNDTCHFSGVKNSELIRFGATSLVVRNSLTAFACRVEPNGIWAFFVCSDRQCPLQQYEAVLYSTHMHRGSELLFWLSFLSVFWSHCIKTLVTFPTEPSARFCTIFDNIATSHFSVLQLHVVLLHRVVCVFVFCRC